MANVHSNNARTIYVINMNKDEAQTLLDIVRSIAGSLETSRRKYTDKISWALSNVNTIHPDFFKITAANGYTAKDMDRKELQFKDGWMDDSYETLAHVVVSPNKQNDNRIMLTLNLFEAQALMDVTGLCTGSAYYSRYKHVYSINYGLRCKIDMWSDNGLKHNPNPKDIIGSINFKGDYGNEAEALKPLKKPVPVKNPYWEPLTVADLVSTFDDGHSS